MITVFLTGSPAPVADVPTGGVPDLSLVTVAYGTGPVLLDMLASLVASLDGSGLAYEVIVVDNAHPRHPDRPWRELALSTRGVRVVRPDRNLGFGGGCELGVLHSRGRMLAFVNPDLAFPTGWLPPLIAALDDLPAPAIVAPVLAHPDGAVQEAGSTIDWEGSTTMLRAPLTDGVHAVETVSAACWVMRRADHERVGGFDPDYFPAYFEDVDLALRVARMGGVCAVHGGVTVVHHTGTGTPDPAPPAHAQKAVLREHFPELRWTRPGLPADAATFWRPGP